MQLYLKNLQRFKHIWIETFDCENHLEYAKSGYCSHLLWKKRCTYDKLDKDPSILANNIIMIGKNCAGHG